MSALILGAASAGCGTAEVPHEPRGAAAEERILLEQEEDDFQRELEEEDQLAAAEEARQHYEYLLETWEEETVGCQQTSGLRCAEVAALKEVIDGDTIELLDGRLVRLVAVDAPEIHPSAECGGADAKRRLETLLAEPGEKVLGTRLLLDSPRGGPAVTFDSDRYGRLLREVRVIRFEDEFPVDVNVGQRLIMEGLARFGRFAPAPGGSALHELATEPYVDAERTARRRHLGGWAACGWL